MILTVDIGNTNIVLGVFREEELVFTARISTDKDRTADEYSVLLRGIFEINGVLISPGLRGSSSPRWCLS